MEKKVLFTLMFCFVSKVSFADNNNMKIAIVDMQKIEQTVAISKDLNNKLAKKEKELHADILKKKNKLEADYKSIEAKKAVLSREELEKKVRTLQDNAQKLEMDSRVYEQAFNVSRMMAGQEIQGIVQKAVNQVASDKYDIVIPTAIALYINVKKFEDVTSKVISKIDGISKTIDYEKIFKNAKEQAKSVAKK